MSLRRSEAGLKRDVSHRAAVTPTEPPQSRVLPEPVCLCPRQLLSSTELPRCRKPNQSFHLQNARSGPEAPGRRGSGPAVRGGRGGPGAVTMGPCGSGPAAGTQMAAVAQGHGRRWHKDTEGGGQPRRAASSGQGQGPGEGSTAQGRSRPPQGNARLISAGKGNLWWLN